MQHRRIAVVGAGASGLCSAKYLIRAGHQVTVYEAGSYVGGLWKYANDNGASIAYKSLHINSEKRQTQFHDFPFAPGVQEFPSHQDMSEYLHSYAAHFGVLRNTKFRARVASVQPGEAGSGVWRVGLEDGSEAEFDAVVVAPGHQSAPALPAFAKNFTGEMIHANAYREPSSYQGKRVVVVGSGNSGCDIASDVCVLAERTVMVARSPELIVPKLFLGRPVTQITGLFDRPWLPSGAPQFARNLITRMVHGRMEQWGFKTPPRGIRTHPTSNALLINHIAYRRIEVANGIADVRGKLVEFADGSSAEFDAMICATGYELTLPFLEGVVQVADRGLDLYKQVVEPRWPGLYFAGFSNAAGSSNLRMFELQARLISQIESGLGQLPSQSEMEYDIQERRQYIAKHYPGGPRYTMEIEAAEYTEAMNAAIEAAARRLSKGASPSAAISSDLDHKPSPEKISA
jgi:choline dehydrogenase-like flavoprotein